MRKCTTCKELKPLDAEHFCKDRSRTSGFNWTCLPCERLRGKARHLKNPRPFRYSEMTRDQKQLRLEFARKYFKTPKGRAIGLVNAYQRADLKRGRVFNITQEFLLTRILPFPCIYCGETEIPRGCDRINNAIGHTFENVVPCCFHCNIARGDNFTHEEMFELGKAIRKIKAIRSANGLKTERITEGFLLSDGDLAPVLE